MRGEETSCGFRPPEQTPRDVSCFGSLQVAGHLWHLVSVKAQLVQHLRALKDYFLLARGDFYQAWLSEVCPCFAQQPYLTAVLRTGAKDTALDHTCPSMTSAAFYKRYTAPFPVRFVRGCPLRQCRMSCPAVKWKSTCTG